MAYTLTDISAIAILAAVLVVVYFIGSYWKHRTLTKYAHWFEERFSPRARVQFASYGHAGLRVKCTMNDKNDAFRELHFAVTLGARENVMYYPLLHLMHDFDRINCWGIMNKGLKSNLRIVKASDKKQVNYSESKANLRRLETPELQALGYVVYASDRDHGLNFLVESTVISRLREFRDVELIELDSSSSTITFVSKLKGRRLPELMDFILRIGNAA